MKHLVTAVLLLLTTISAHAGVAYDFTTSTTGLAAQTMSGAVKADGSKIRVEFTAGDGVLFQNGSVALSTDGGKTLFVTDPRSRSFYQLDLSALLGSADSLFKQFGGLVKMDVTNPRVSTRDGGKGEAIAGFPTQRSTVNSAYDMNVDAFGQKIIVRMQMSTEVWWTDKLGSEFTNFLQLRGLRTGVDSVDKLLAAQNTAIKGFPLKQVTTTNVVMNGNTMTSKTTSEVSNVRKADVAASEFVVPKGFVLAPSPVEKMMGR